MASDSTPIPASAGGGIRTRDLLITNPSRSPERDAAVSQNRPGKVKRQPHASPRAHDESARVESHELALLRLASCEVDPTTIGGAR
jgi:hypothetical protein